MGGVTALDSAPATETAPGTGLWLFGSWFDALFVANLAWPLFLLAQWGDGFSGRDGVQFWQLYYITTPHRWITLILVFLDRQRFNERRFAFLAVAAAIVVVCLGVRLTTGTLTCLLAVDYIWNAWHFAAQHHGIYRIYGRLSDPARTKGLTIEKWVLRLFLLYVILRVASATWSEPVWERSLQVSDGLMAVIPIWLIVQDIVRTGGGALGGTTYLISVASLYLSMLAAVHWHWPGLVLSLATASALFHAIEYLALVSWSVQRRQALGLSRLGILGYLAPRWALSLGVFVLVLGMVGWLLDQRLLKSWLLINVIVAFMHYAYDGMIWRLRTGSASSTYILPPVGSIQGSA
jgi:hypothetical protein